MPIHDWTRVADGIYHHFHHSWIEEIQRALNADILPPSYYAMAEQRAVGFGPDILTLQHPDSDPTQNGFAESTAAGDGSILVLDPPRVEVAGAIDRDTGRKSSAVAVRHVSDDRVVAVIEVVSPANKTRHGLRSFLEKAGELIDAGVHLLLLDLMGPGPHDPLGLHAALLAELSDAEQNEPFAKPLLLASYEATAPLRFYLNPVAVGDCLPEMPLFLIPGGHVRVPLEPIYQRAWQAFPQRWRRVVEG